MGTKSPELKILRCLTILLFAWHAYLIILLWYCLPYSHTRLALGFWSKKQCWNQGHIVQCQGLNPRGQGQGHDVTCQIHGPPKVVFRSRSVIHSRRRTKIRTKKLFTEQEQNENGNYVWRIEWLKTRLTGSEFAGTQKIVSNRAMVSDNVGSFTASDHCRNSWL